MCRVTLRRLVFFAKEDTKLIRPCSIIADRLDLPGIKQGRVSAIQRGEGPSASDDAKKVATGAIIGAIAGQIFGKRTKSTVIGAATGAAAGAVVAGVTAKYDGCVPSGGRISLTLSEAMVVQQSE